MVVPPQVDVLLLIITLYKLIINNYPLQIQLEVHYFDHCLIFLFIHVCLLFMRLVFHFIFFF